jgi:hypothetical protein
VLDAAPQLLVAHAQRSGILANGQFLVSVITRFDEPLSKLADGRWTPRLGCIGASRALGSQVWMSATFAAPLWARAPAAVRLAAPVAGIGGD